MVRILCIDAILDRHNFSLDGLIVSGFLYSTLNLPDVFY